MNSIDRLFIRKDSLYMTVPLRKIIVLPRDKNTQRVLRLIDGLESLTLSTFRQRGEAASGQVEDIQYTIREAREILRRDGADFAQAYLESKENCPAGSFVD